LAPGSLVRTFPDASFVPAAREALRQSLTADNIAQEAAYLRVEKPVLAPLPAERFDMSQWSRATVNIDYHISLRWNFYSVPYILVQQDPR
jgi:hypothetical protein